MPAYNASKYIEQAVRSVLDQTYRNIELIVVDDGSSDDTASKLGHFRDERMRVISQLNQGACVARNRGIWESKGEFVKFLDADDILYPEAIATQVEQSLTLARNEEVFGDIDHIDADGNVFWHNTIDAEEFERKNQDEWLLLHWSMLTSCPLHRRELLMQVGGFDVHLRGAHETVLHFAMSIAGVRFVYRPGAVYQYRIHHDPNRISIQRESAMPNFVDRVYLYDKLLSLTQGKYGLQANGLTNFVTQQYFNLARKFYLAGAKDKGRYCMQRIKGIPHSKKYPRYYGSSKLAGTYLLLGRLLGYDLAKEIMERIAQRLGLKPRNVQPIISSIYSPSAEKQ